jgi:hypothetical protein
MYGNRYGIEPLELDAPASLAQALGLKDRDIRRELGLEPGPLGDVGQRPSAYHGHGVDTDYKKPEILQFFHKLSDGVQKALRDENAPLVLAGPVELLPVYREANRYPYLLGAAISRDPESLSPAELHSKALDLVGPVFSRAEKQARERFQWLSGIGSRLASTDLKDIVTAACTGRVDTLFVALDVRRWGWLDRDTLRVEPLDAPATGAEDLLDAAAVCALENRSSV